MKESNRQKKFSKLIQKEISGILQLDIIIPEGTMLTVTVVRTSPDLRMAKIYISVFPDDRGEEVLEFLTENNKHIRHLLAGRIGGQVRFIPEIHFFIDDTAEEVEYMENLLKQINKPGN